jgi:hypothetical protein
MDWSKVIYIFFSLMSLTTTAGFLYENNATALFLAASINIISTILKIGVRNLRSAELLASSLVADLHLLPAFIVLTFYGNLKLAISLAIGAVIANIFSIILVFIDSAKNNDAIDEEY